jgi:hypothetical protein
MEPDAGLPRSINEAARGVRPMISSDAGTPESVSNYDPAPEQEKVRSNIAYWLMGALLAVIGVYCVVGLEGGYACWIYPDCSKLSSALKDLREFLAVALASITGLAGAVTGFYFGAQAAKKG